MQYIIVKYAADGTWEQYFYVDPKVGCHSSYSAHSTYIGKQYSICSSYATPFAAAKDLNKILDANPSGYYDVCPVIA